MTDVEKARERVLRFARRWAKVGLRGLDLDAAEMAKLKLWGACADLYEAELDEQASKRRAAKRGSR